MTVDQLWILWWSNVTYPRPEEWFPYPDPWSVFTGTGLLDYWQLLSSSQHWWSWASGW